jgi:hypothetical protein
MGFDRERSFNWNTESFPFILVRNVRLERPDVGI